VGLRVVVDAVVKRKLPGPHRESKPRTPNVQPVAQSLYRLSYPGSHENNSGKENMEILVRREGRKLVFYVESPHRVVIIGYLRCKSLHETETDLGRFLFCHTK
jgi:hypothetical protein